MEKTEQLELEFVGTYEIIMKRTVRNIEYFLALLENIRIKSIRKKEDS